jgi:hypothetical protein
VHDDAVDVVRPGVDDPSAALSDDEIGEVPEGVGDTVDVDAPLLQGLAGVPALQEPELFAVAYEEVGDAAQERGPLGDGCVWPLSVVEGAPGGLDGGVRVRHSAFGDHGERLRVRRVENVARGP